MGGVCERAAATVATGPPSGRRTRWCRVKERRAWGGGLDCIRMVAFVSSDIEMGWGANAGHGAFLRFARCEP